MQRSTPSLRMMLGVVILGLTVLSAFPTRAASTFGGPAFAQQWQAGEAVTPNFWGPLSTARDGQQEMYNGASRTVQYFDKGRMELTNGVVTNGLLTTELLSGHLQTGDATFATYSPSVTAMAGDQHAQVADDVPVPTYYVVSRVREVTEPAAMKVGSASMTSLHLYFGGSPHSPAIYGPANYPDGATFADANIAHFDDVTHHNVPAAFATYRDRAGLATIGYAIIEPFWSPVKVGGVVKRVLIQAFERRVLTYTPDNPADYRVEMGNVGQHYYEWRYVTLAQASTSATMPSAPAAPGAASPAPVAPTTVPVTAVFTEPLAAFITRAAMADTVGNASADAYTENGIALLQCEHGMMLFLPKRNLFYALVEQSGSPLIVIPHNFSDSGLTTTLAPGPRPGTFVPRLGFGKVWQDNISVQEQLGYATGDEQRYTGTVQAFAYGLLVANPSAKVVYALNTTVLRWYALPLS